MDTNKICGGCLFYLSTYLGGECRLTDNAVDYSRQACIDFMDAEDSNYETDTPPEIGRRNNGKKRNTKQNANR